MNSFDRLSLFSWTKNLPNADGSEEPVSEFLLAEEFSFDMQNQTSPTSTATNASAPAETVATDASELDMALASLLQ